MRILFISEEVAPFTSKSENADLVRMLPEQLQESGDFEVRIMMPRYGIISERRNRLHEVIRLSGTEIEVDGHKETLKVKVASIPGIRLQVYFMDNNHFFKKKGILSDKEGTPFGDNAQRALFFSKSVLDTIRKLGWTPDIVHCFGWMSAFTPLLLRTEYSSDPVFEKAKSIYTPGTSNADADVKSGFLSQLTYPQDFSLNGHSVNDLGHIFSDMAIYSSTVKPESPATPQFSEDIEEMCTQVKEWYDQIFAEVTV